jgi:hypothetical protein
LGFIEYYDERDAEEAIRSMDRMQLGGREVRTQGGACVLQHAHTAASWWS